MRTSALLVEKTSGFSKFMACPHGQEGSSHCGQGREGQFLRPPLWTAPNSFFSKFKMTSSHCFQDVNSSRCLKVG